MFPILYYGVAGSLFVAVLWQCRVPVADGPSGWRTRPDALFLTLGLGLLVWLRLPGVFYNVEINPDESQLLTQAITLAHDPVYGRSVDGTSIGPISSYLLLLPRAFGRPFDYTSARLTALALIALSCVLFYAGLRRFTDRIVSRLMWLPALLFFGCATHTDFIHFSSELPSLVILTAVFGLTLRALQTGRATAGGLLALGAVAGLTPYAKLQALPLIGVVLGTLTVYGFATNRSRAFRFALALAAGFALPTVLVFGLAYLLGVVDYFVDYYFVGNLTTYAQLYADMPLVRQGFLTKAGQFLPFVGKHPDFGWFIVLSAVAVSAAGLLAWVRTRRPLRWSWIATLITLTLLSAFWAVITPGTRFGHHLLLLVFPLGWFSGMVLQYVVNAAGAGRTDQPRPVLAKRVRARLVLAAGALLVAEILLNDAWFVPYVKHRVHRKLGRQTWTVDDWQYTQHRQDWFHSRNPPLVDFPDKAHLTLSPVARVVQRYAQPTDQLAVWGWDCRPYIETGLGQGVSENHTQRSIIPNAMRDQYLDRYVRELRQNRPALFLDAVGPASLILTRPDQRHEHFAGLARAVADQYVLVDSVDAVRIYVRRDRLSSRRLSKFGASATSL